MSDNMCSVTCILKALGFIQSKCWQTFSIQDRIVNISGFSGHTVSVATIQLRSCSTKVAIDNTYVNGHSCFNKTCFIEVWLLGHSLPTCDLYSTSKIPLLNTECFLYNLPLFAKYFPTVCYIKTREVIRTYFFTFLHF